MGDDSLAASLTAFSEGEDHRHCEDILKVLYRKPPAAQAVPVLTDERFEILRRALCKMLIKFVHHGISLSLKFGILHGVSFATVNFRNIQKITPGILYSEGVVIMFC